MKNIYYVISLLLLTFSAKAQRVDLACPTVEWHQPIQVGYHIGGNPNNYYLNGIIFGELLHSYLPFSPYVSPHFGFNIATLKNGHIVMGSNYYHYLHIDNRTITNNHNRVSGVLIEGDAEGAITSVHNTYSTGRAAYQPNQLHFEGIHKQKHVIVMHNQASSFNNHNYNSGITNVASRLLYWNATYSLLTLDSNNQTINRFSVPNLRLQNLVVDSLGNIYLMATFDSTITLGSQQFTPKRNGGDGVFGRLFDRILIKLNTQYQIQWAIPIIGEGYEFDYNLQLDKDLNVYIAGISYHDSLTIGNQTIRDSFVVAHRIYFSKITSWGTVSYIKHFKKMLGTRHDALLNLEIDANGNVYLLASINGYYTFDNSPVNAYRLGQESTLVFRYKERTQTFDYVVLQSTGKNAAIDMVLHPTDGHLYVVGSYEDTMYINNSYKIASGVHSSGFIARIATDNSSNELSIDWFHDIQSDSVSCITGIAVAKDGGLYITGVSKSDYTFLGKSYTINPMYINHFYAKLGGLSNEVVFDGSTYAAIDTGASSYQWLDCNRNREPVVGATSRIFTPDVPGSYAVVLSTGSCQVVSACFGTVNVISPSLLSGASIYPNPFSQHLAINIPEAYQQEIIYIQVTDVLGRRIWQQKGLVADVNKSLAVASAQWLGQQLYHIQLTVVGTQEKVTFKLVKH